MRALLDTNILISYLLTSDQQGAVRQVVNAGLLQRYVLLLPQALLDEFVHKIRTASYLVERIPPDRMRALLRILASNAELLPSITGTIPAIVRDPMDDCLLTYAFTGRADYLVTGDRDLLVLGQVDQLQIVTVRQFLTLLECIEDYRRSQT